MTLDEFKRDLAELEIPAQRDAEGHFPGCLRYGCEITECHAPQWRAYQRMMERCVD